MSDAVWLALLIAIPSILTVLVPILRARIDNAQKNLEREADWARQDKIAAKLAAKVTETASNAAVVRQEISDKIDVVHTLVNGNVTDAMHRELDGLRREIALLEENRSLKLKLQQEPNPLEEARLELARARMTELRASLAIKLTTDATAKEQAGTVKAERA